MITPQVLKELLFLWAGIGSVLGIYCYTSLGIGIGIRRDKMVLKHLYKYLNFVLLTFPKQAHYFSLNALVFLAVLSTLYQPRMSLFDSLGMSLNNQLIF